MRIALHPLGGLIRLEERVVGRSTSKDRGVDLGST